MLIWNIWLSLYCKTNWKSQRIKTEDAKRPIERGGKKEKENIQTILTTLSKLIGINIIHHPHPPSTSTIHHPHIHTRNIKFKKLCILRALRSTYIRDLHESLPPSLCVCMCIHANGASAQTHISKTIVLIWLLSLQYYIPSSWKSSLLYILLYMMITSFSTWAKILSGRINIEIFPALFPYIVVCKVFTAFIHGCNWQCW